MDADRAVQFSLITATVGRDTVLRRLLASLDEQTYRHFELIVIDQNEDERLAPELAPYRERFRMMVLRSPRGASRARNRGLLAVTGDVIGFPDDDCWYEPCHLERVARLFQENPEWDGVSGCTINEQGKIVLGQYDTQPGYITPINIWRRANANALYLRRKVVKETGNFDEELGVGAETPWQSSEDVDLPLRAVQKGFRLMYLPDLRVFHPSVDEMETGLRIKRAYRYSLGMGRTLRKHRYPAWFLAYNWLGPCKPLLLSLLRGKWGEVRFCAALSLGRFRGWIGRP
jgi:glycosyltransferase involved in cell wall biosynthesis